VKKGSGEGQKNKRKICLLIDFPFILSYGKYNYKDIFHKRAIGSGIIPSSSERFQTRHPENACTKIPQAFRASRDISNNTWIGFRV
jgi:hypothetical protein